MLFKNLLLNKGKIIMVKKTYYFFKIITKINPILALMGTFCLSNNWQAGWYLLMTYNILNVYVYSIKRKDFWMYALVSLLHFSFGLWAIFKNLI